MPNKLNAAFPFRKPWEHGAAAYHEADTFDAATEGFKRVRTVKMFHMPAGSEADERECVTCHGKLGEPSKLQGSSGKPDLASTWHYVPKRGIIGGQHYICSWQTLLTAIYNR